MNRLFWRFANLYAYVFGWPAFRSLHHAIAALALHALGYDNVSCSGEERFVRDVLKPSGIRVCVDVGANVGTYSSMLAQELGATVYSIEPSASSFARLSDRARLTPAIRPIRAAASVAPGVAKLYSREERSEKASLVAEEGSKIVEEVRVDTIDALVADVGCDCASVDFVKVDVEGFEFEALSGMSMRPRFIQFEFNINHLRRGRTLKSIIDLFPECRAFRLLPHGRVPVRADAFADNVFMFSNYVLVRSDGER